jgi:hypothetical protein
MGDLKADVYISLTQALGHLSDLSVDDR